MSGPAASAGASCAGRVAAATAEAAQAGAEILREGGNAVDAAVAVSLALAVTEPAGSGIGGQLMLLLQRPDSEPLVLNGASFAPASTPAGAGLDTLVGHRATTVPTLLLALDAAWRHYGSGRLAWARLVEPALRWAREGYPLGAFRQRALLRQADAIRRDAVATQLLLADDGSVPEEGSVMRQPILARTLERIAAHGAEDFYRGTIARELAADMAAHGGWLTERDLAAVPEPRAVAPLRGSYRGWDVHTLPPPASGWSVLLALNLLEQVPAGELAVDGPRRPCRLADALAISRRYRRQRPLLDPGADADALSRRIGKETARRIFRAFLRSGAGETTHFSVVDRDGAVAAVTQSLNSYFGARTGSRKLGFLYNDYLREFVVGSERQASPLRPGAVPRSFMSATLLARAGRPVVALGSPGDDRIISAVVQVISHWVDRAQGIEAAVAAPRLHVPRDDTVLLEQRPADARVLLALERRGYAVHVPLSSLFTGDHNPYFGGVHAVALEDGVWRGAADPRRDGAVVPADEPGGG